MKALLLIDIQNDYFPGGALPLHGTEKAASNARRLLDKFRDGKMPVIFIKHISARPEATFFLPGTNGVEIHETVAPAGNEVVIEKHFPNSFRDTGLDVYLKSNRIDELVVCGMMTHMCVDATVRAAKDIGYKCTLVGDACATKDLTLNGETVKAEHVHKAFLAALNYYFASVVSTDEYQI